MSDACGSSFSSSFAAESDTERWTEMGRKERRKGGGKEERKEGSTAWRTEGNRGKGKEEGYSLVDGADNVESVEIAWGELC